MAQKPFLKPGTIEHFSKGRAEGKGQVRCEALFRHGIKHVQKGDISFNCGLKEPVFFKGVFVFRVVYIRKMGVKEDYK
jgi:hypothetical protein